MASKEVRNQAETKLGEAAAALGCADPRPPLRDRMRDLKGANPDAFERARAHYEQAVLPALASGAEPLREWLDYGRFLGSLTAAGRMVAIHSDGRAAPYTSPLPKLLVLYIPDEPAEPVLPLLSPAEPSPAQRAAMDLLVHRRLSL